MKSVKIEVPQGYEIDKEKSTFENIVFKEVKKELPKTWKELVEIKGYYVTDDSTSSIADCLSIGKNKNVFATKEQAEASIALAQLSQLREVYCNGWVPVADELRYCIRSVNGEMRVESFYTHDNFLSFQDRTTSYLFLENFKDLIEQAKPLLS